MVSSEENSGDKLEREMYLLRRMTAKLLVNQGMDWRRDMYFCSLSARTIVYKGMTNADVSVFSVQIGGDTSASRHRGCRRKKLVFCKLRVVASIACAAYGLYVSS